MEKIYFLTLILPGITTGLEFWGNPNFFGNYDLHFSQNNFVPLNKSFENYLNLFRINPLLLEGVSSNEFFKKNKFWTSEGSLNLEKHRKIRHYSGLISMIHLKPQNPDSIQPSSYKLLNSVISYINPNYVFAQVESPIIPEYYQNYAKHYAGTAKLFLWTHHTSKIYILCLVCSSPSWELSPTGISLSKLDTIWDSINTRNMNLNNLIVAGFDSLTPICGSSVKNFDIYDDAFHCMALTLGVKYNFTIRSNVANFISKIGIFTQTRDSVLGGFSVSKSLLNPYKFVIITNFPSAMNSFEAFTSPFDEITWVLILISCISFEFFLTTDHLLFHSEQKENRNRLFEGMLNIVCSLIGQVSDNAMNLFHSKKGGGLIWILWLLFGSYFLMNNLYQGSVYSYLTVILPAPVPKTMTKLKDSKVPVLTTNGIYINITRTDSTLKHYLIPQMIRSLGQNSSYSNLLSDLNKNVVHITKYKFLNMFLYWVEQSQPILEPSSHIAFFNRDMFAIFDGESSLQKSVQLLQAWGGRYIVSNLEDTMIHHNNMWLVRRNFLLPTIHRDVSQLDGAGLLRRWDALKNLLRVWSDIAAFGKDTAVKWFNREMSGAKEKDV